MVVIYQGQSPYDLITSERVYLSTLVSLMSKFLTHELWETNTNHNNIFLPESLEGRIKNSYHSEVQSSHFLKDDQEL